MRLFSLALHPPPLALTHDLEWVLCRAFAPPSQKASSPSTREQALQLALALGLNARIGTRIPAEQLRQELGPSLAQKLLIANLACQCNNDAIKRLVAVIAETAAELRIRFSLLKGAALVLLGCAQGRWVSDCDCLVDPHQAPVLAAALQKRGFRRARETSPPHHLPTLVGPLGVVELHIALPGLKGHQGKGWLGLGGLEDASLVQPAGPPFSGQVLLPAPQLLAAHAIAHGLHQHRFSPDAYPAFRVVADLLDLGAGSSLQPFKLEELPVGLELDRQELKAMNNLCQLLAHGQLALLKAMPPVTLEQKLLAHLVAGATEPQYRQSLKLRAWVTQVRLRSPSRSLRHALRELFLLTPEQVEVLYGKPRNRTALRLRQLGRPLDLTWRTLRTLGAFLAIRLARRQPPLSSFSESPQDGASS